MVRRLLEAKASDPENSFPDKAGRTPLHEAVKGGNLETVRLLAEAGMDPEAVDFLGTTPKELAANTRSEGMMAAVLAGRPKEAQNPEL